MHVLLQSVLFLQQSMLFLLQSMLLQKTNCLMEDQYTILKLESLLTLNKLLDFSTLRLSDEAPYLMLVVCEAAEQLKEETKDMIRELFETM